MRRIRTQACPSFLETGLRFCRGAGLVSWETPGKAVSSRAWSVRSESSCPMTLGLATGDPHPTAPPWAVLLVRVLHPLPALPTLRPHEPETREGGTLVWGSNCSLVIFLSWETLGSGLPFLSLPLGNGGDICVTRTWPGAVSLLTGQTTVGEMFSGGILAAPGTDLPETKNNSVQGC